MMFQYPNQTPEEINENEYQVGFPNQQNDVNPHLGYLENYEANAWKTKTPKGECINHNPSGKCLHIHAAKPTGVHALDDKMHVYVETWIQLTGIHAKYDARYHHHHTSQILDQFCNSLPDDISRALSKYARMVKTPEEAIEIMSTPEDLKAFKVLADVHQLRDQMKMLREELEDSC